MKYAIVSDIHANLEAFQRVLADARRHGVQEMICLGDVVGYGPLPAETLRTVRESCSTVLAGNHDDAVSGLGDSSSFIDLAGDAVQRHREALAVDELAWLKALPYAANLEGAVCAHGDVFDPSKFYYIEEEKDAVANFGATESQLVFVGHTHVPCIFLTGRSGTIYKTDAQDFTLEDGKRYIVNPGSVGYPRESNGQCYSSYVIYDSVERTVTYRFLPFSIASVMQRGQTPKRTKKLVIAAIAAVAAVSAGLAAFLLTPKTTADDDPALVLETKALPLTSDLKHVRANLELAKGSDPVLLRATFASGNGSSLAEESVTVKKSSTGKIRVPNGATEVRFSVLKMKQEGAPVLLSFQPSASVK